jgi:tight adherence protein B
VVSIQFVKNSTDQSTPNFTGEENGSLISNIAVYPGQIGQYTQSSSNAVMLAIDASDSMAGDKLRNAKAAAQQFISQAHDPDRIGLVLFGGSSKVVVQPTTDYQKVLDAVNAIQLTHGTHIFDGVHDAVGAMPSDATQKAIVLLSDGADLGSSLTRQQAEAEANSANVSIYSVGLLGGSSDPQTLQDLANATNGEYQGVSNAGELAGIYAVLGKQLLHSYWLQYTSSQASGSDVKLILHSPGHDDTIYSYSTPQIKVDGPVHLTPAPTVKPAKPMIPLPAGPVGILIASLPLAALLGLLGYLYIKKKTTVTLEKRIEPYVRQERDKLYQPADKHANATGLKAWFAPLLRMSDNLLGKSSLFAKFRFLLEQANLPLKESELLLIMLGAGVFSGLIGMIMMGLFWGVIFFVVGVFFPFLVVKLKARKRKRLFESQLADVLSTVAASLKAGHSFNQAMTAVAKETPDPTRHEFNRVMTEARLGMPMEEALDAMAARLGSADFEFAVTTVNIQRTVGGSLAEILEMVSDTVRARQQFRKKVKALTSMGSMSAYVLLGMPIFMAGILELMNSNYMRPLFFTSTGHMMMIAGAVLMFLGWWSCNKIVSIKV